MRLLAVLLFALGCCLQAVGQAPAADSLPGDTGTISQPVVQAPAEGPTALPDSLGLPVLLNEQPLFYLHSKEGRLTLAERVDLTNNRLLRLMQTPDFEADSLLTEDRGSDAMELYVITYKGQLVLALTAQDAQDAALPLPELAKQRRERIAQAITLRQASQSIWLLVQEIGLTLLVVVVLVVLVLLINRVFRRFYAWLERQKGVRFKSFYFRQYEVLNAEQMTRTMVLAARGLRLLSIILLVYLALPVVFLIFPATQSYAETLLGYVLQPLAFFGSSILAFIPNLITIVLVIIITRYALKLLRYIANEIDNGDLKFEGFHADWAKPTYNIVRFLVYAFALVVIFPYLPGSDSDVFKGVSVFLGVLISLGSSGAISNTVAGLVITYMRPFQIGDRIRIGDVSGDVVQKTLLVTRLRTIKNEEITIPNSFILSGKTINYSTLSKQEGLIVHTAVTIGYDVPWRQVQQLLVDAAKSVELIQPQPEPFVLQTSLDDFYVSYQLNAYTPHASRMVVIYSELHKAIQDKFNEAGVEILSPHYRAPRDGNQTTIPAQYLPPDYKPPAFRVDTGH